MVVNSNITIRDVAKTAGVSTQTVSRVINNRPDVAPETRTLIKKIIHDLGYAPNTIAASLSRGRTNTLGVVGFGLEYFGPANVLTGIESQADESGCAISLMLIEKIDQDKVEHVLNQFIAQQVMGIIWAIPGFTDTMNLIENATRDLSIPIILLNRKPVKDKVVVSVENHTGAKLAVEHLFEQGYQKIGIITGPLTWWEAQERLAGWREVVLEKVQIDPEKWIFEGDWGVESGGQGFRNLIAAHPDMDAIFVSNDQMSLGVIQAANQAGLKIPSDLGIVGFDNIPESKFFLPSLTTIHQDARKLGALAVTRLSEYFSAGNGVELDRKSGDFITPQLIIRQSSVR